MKKILLLQKLSIHLYSEKSFRYNYNLRLTVYIAIVATCIPLLALFLTFGILKTGNIAGDNEQLARRTRRTIELISGGVGVSALRRRTGFGQLGILIWPSDLKLKPILVFRLCHLLKSIWQHFPPLPQTMYNYFNYQ